MLAVNHLHASVSQGKVRCGMESLWRSRSMVTVPRLNCPAANQSFRTLLISKTLLLSYEGKSRLSTVPFC